MDSITQAVLGAAVVEATAGRQLGNKAIYWGLFFGTLPDLDILFYPWLDELQRLGWHRGISHSLLLMTLTAPLWGKLVCAIHQQRLSFRRASVAVWVALFTHVLIDCFTVYGTQIFEPFSNYRVGFNNLFIIDPLFTVPMILALLFVPWFRAEHPVRRRINNAALCLSSLYVMWSFGAKAVADHRIEASLAGQGIPHVRYQSAPTPLNTILWRALVETEDGYLIGYTSLLDTPPHDIRFERVPRNAELLGEAKDSPAAVALRWFSQDYFGVTAHNGGFLFSDWRFGEVRDGTDKRAIFTWHLTKAGDAWTFRQVRLPGPNRSDMLPLLWRRIQGERVF